MRRSASRRSDPLELNILQSGVSQPFLHPVDGNSIVGGEGGFEQDADIRRLLLHLPISLCERQRRLRRIQQMQGEPSFFPQMHSIPAQVAGREAVAQLFYLSR